MTPEQKIEAEAEEYAEKTFLKSDYGIAYSSYIAGRSGGGLEREKELEEENKRLKCEANDFERAMDSYAKSYKKLQDEVELLEEIIQLGELQNSDLIEKIIAKDKEIEALKGVGREYSSDQQEFWEEVAKAIFPIRGRTKPNGINYLKSKYTLVKKQ